MMLDKPKHSTSSASRTLIRVTWFLCFMVVAVVFYSGLPSDVKQSHALFAEQQKTFEFKAMHVQCSQQYIKEVSKYPGCRPKKCSRFVMDNLFSTKELDKLVDIFKKGLTYGISHGGASILDLQTGALSRGVHFVNLYKMALMKDLFKTDQLQNYEKVKERIINTVAAKFGLSPLKIYLTTPTFFSRLTNRSPLSLNDEYWHVRCDRDIYPAFHFTSQLYLNDYGKDFLGGQFRFVENDNSSTSIQPKKGRILLFTSGCENRHYVERVTTGARFAFTVSFTCDPQMAVVDKLA